jgi:hypothetical protein
MTMCRAFFSTDVLHSGILKVLSVITVLFAVPPGFVYAQPLPDLAITRISYDDNHCQPTVRLENLGGKLNSAMYRAGGVYLQRIEDGSNTARIPLLRVDTGTRLLRGQPVIYWTDYSPIRARRSVRYELVGVGPDANTANNSDQAYVPVRCGGSGLVAPQAPRYKH